MSGVACGITQSRAGLQGNFHSFRASTGMWWALVSWALLLLCTRELRAGELRGWPVKLESGVANSHPAVGDIDGDGRKEVVLGAGQQLFALRPTGGTVNGWPVMLAAAKNAKAEFNPSPTLCDVDGDGKLEVALLAPDNKFHVLDGRGVDKKGFPIDGGESWGGAPACADMDGDGRPELLWTSADGVIHAVDGTGRPAAGFPLKNARAAEGMLATGDIRAEPGVELAFGGTDGKLHLLGRDRRGQWTELSGFPVQTEFTISGGPSVGDLDGDGTMEIAFGSQDFSIYAVRSTGQMMPGFPVKTGYRIYAQPALGDLDGDGRREVVIGSGDSKIHALRFDGTNLPGWPVSVGGRITASAAVGDLDGDGAQEVVVACTDGKLHVLRANGAPVGGFPETPGGVLASAPVVVDLDGDNRIEILVGGAAGLVHAYSFMNLGKVRRPTL